MRTTRLTSLTVIGALLVLGLASPAVANAGARSTFPAAAGDVFWSAEPNQTEPGVSLMQTWAACGSFDPASKIVRAYTRYRTSGPGTYLAGGTSNLRCGTNTGYGYRHIYTNHRTQWEQKGALTAQNWRDVADYAMEWSLKDPDSTRYRSANQAWAFQRTIYLVNKSTGQGVGQMEVCTVVGLNTQNVITSYPGACS